MIKKIFTLLAVSLCMGLLSHTATAAVVSTSTTVNSFSGSGGVNLVPVNGLSQFDASLGTLTGITLNAVIDSYQVDLSLDNFDDPGTGALFDFAELSGQISLNIPKNTGGGLLFASEVFGDSIFGEFDSVTVGPTNSSESEDSTTRLQADNLFNNFIGPGAINFIDLGIFTFFGSATVFLDDGSSVSGEPALDSFSVGPSTVSIDYTYTSMVPVPAAAWLFGTGFIGLFVMRRNNAGLPEISG